MAGWFEHKMIIALGTVVRIGLLHAGVPTESGFTGSSYSTS